MIISLVSQSWRSLIQDQIGQFYCSVKIGGCVRWMQVFFVLPTAISKICRDSWFWVHLCLIYSNLGQPHQYFGKNVACTREGRGFVIIWRGTVEMTTDLWVKLRQRLSGVFCAKLCRFSYFCFFKNGGCARSILDFSIIWRDITKITPFDNLDEIA